MEKRGLTIQDDELGNPGIAVPKEGGDPEEKEIKVGRRLSAAKVKSFGYDPENADKQDMAQQHAKNAKGLAVKMNSKDLLRFDRVCKGKAC